MSDKEFFLAIWEQRNHVSFIDGSFLGDEPRTFMFAHVLGKGAYPKFRFKKENIILLTLEQHQAWDHQPKSKLKADKKWLPVFKLEEILRRKYYTIK